MCDRDCGSATWMACVIASMMLACSDAGGEGPQGGAGTAAAGTGGTLAAGVTASAGMGGASGAGGVAGGTAGSGAGASGAAAGASAGTGGSLAGAGGAAGAAGDGGQGAVGACPGVERPAFLDGLTACTSSLECQQAMNGLSYYACRLEPITFVCGGAAPPPPDCTADADCAPAGVCDTFDCGQAMCVLACTAESCGDAARCEQGRCVPKRCDETGATPCPDAFTCVPSSATPTGCVAVACDEGYACLVNHDCAPGEPLADVHGCLTRACTTVADCDCGACVDGLCSPYEGACMNTSPPP